MTAPRTVLLTGGRAAATLELARALHAAGIRVVMAEHIGWHLSRWSRAVARHYRVPWPTRDRPGFIAALAAIIEREAVDLLVPTCEEIFHVAWGRAALPCAVLATDLAALTRLHHKGRFIEAARALGLAVPETTVCADRATLEAAVAGGGGVVLKPVWSRFAARTMILPDGHRGEALPTPTAADPWVVQRYVAGRVLCTWGLAQDGRLVAFCAYETRYTLGLGASASFESLPHPALEAWMARLVAGEGFTGQLGLDVIEAPDGQLYGIEANPRITSGLHLLVGEPGFLERLWTPVAGCVRPTGPRPAMLAISMLLAQRGLRGAAARAEWRAVWRRSREVVWSWRDPVPAVWRFVWLAGVVLRGRRAGRPPAEAIAIDMEFNGD
ncbi:MAG: carbamoylphosphate synthase large subunit [Myxococcales bacterium]|nr:carbamoylphosphate synthase large subunit [Myxococcales bacterium]